MSRDPDAHLHDAVMAAAARDHTAAGTRRRDSLRFFMSLPKVIWWLRRSEKARTGDEHDH